MVDRVTGKTVNRWRDIEAGQRADCTALFIDYGYSEAKPHLPYIKVNSLAEAADWILATTTNALK